MDFKMVTSIVLTVVRLAWDHRRCKGWQRSRKAGYSW